MSKQALKCVTYFVEPASYTLDLKRNVHDVIGIDTRFLKAQSLASDEEIDSLRNMPFFSRLRLLWGDSGHYDFVIFNGVYDKELFFIILFSFIRRNPLKIGIESDTPLYIPGNIIKRVCKSIILRTLFKIRRINGLCGGTNRHRDYFSYYGMNKQRIYFLPMMSNNERFSNAPRKNKEKFIFIYVGRLIKIKNVDLLCSAFSNVFGRSKSVELHIVGDGRQKEFLSTKYIASNIKFTGRKYGNDLCDAYSNASVLVLPSVKEPWGLVVNEALAASIPVISSKFVGANYDLILNKNTGLIFDPMIKGELEKCLLKIFNDEEMYISMSKNGKNMMNGYWNYDLYRDQLLNFLNKKA